MGRDHRVPRKFFPRSREIVYHGAPSSVEAFSEFRRVTCDEITSFRVIEYDKKEGSPGISERPSGLREIERQGTLDSIEASLEFRRVDREGNTFLGVRNFKDF